VGDVVALMNALISGTTYKKRAIEWEKTHSCFNAKSPLVGRKWFQNISKKNLERTLETKLYMKQRRSLQ
jgi:hypothetical protein